jgi:hypothetical protein
MERKERKGAEKERREVPSFGSHGLFPLRTKRNGEMCSERTLRFGEDVIGREI